MERTTDAVAAEGLFRGQLDHGHQPVARILEAAERCLGRTGYGGMSMRSVAQEAGISKSLILYHFQSKDHLLLELQVRFYNRLAASVAAAVAGSGSGSERALEALDRVFAVLAHEGDLSLQTELWARSLSNPALQDRARRLWRHLRLLVVGTLAEILGGDRAELPVPLEGAADLLLGTLLGLGLQAGVEGEGEDVERAFKSLRTIMGLALRQGRDSKADAPGPVGAGSDTWRR